MSLGSRLRDAFLVNFCAASTVEGAFGDKALPPCVYQAEYQEVFTGLIKASEDLGWHLLSADREQGRLSLQRPWGLTTWGDTISINLRPIDRHSVRVDATSFAKGEFFDWGRHSRNIRRYFSDLDTRVRPN